MHGEVDLAKSAPTQHLANPVERDIGDWRLLSQSEGSLDFLHDVADFLGARAELVELRLVLDGLLSPDDLAVEGLLVNVRGHLSDLLLVILGNQPSGIHICDHGLWSSDNIGLVNAILGPPRAVRLRFPHVGRTLL